MSAYTYDIEYKPTQEHGNADMLSRLPVGPDTTFDTTSFSTVVNMIQDEQLKHSPVVAADVQKATKDDRILTQVTNYMLNGWPRVKKHLSKELQPYFDHKHELTLHNGCILRGLRVVIPQSLRKDVLAEIHVSHSGVVRMKSIARLHVWWPNLDREIENRAKQCITCQENSKNPPKSQLHPWETATQPWERLHLDFAGPYQGYMWFVLVDACSKWPEVISMTSTTAEKTIDVLRQLFARFRLPNKLSQTTVHSFQLLNLKNSAATMVFLIHS